MDEQDFPSNAFRPERLPTLRDIVTPLFRHRRLVLLTFMGQMCIRDRCRGILAR